MTFADLHQPGDPLLLPNAWDFASAATLAAQGYRAVGTTSLGVAAAAGVPDGQGLTRDQTAHLATMIRPLPCFITVDVEDGFSDDPDEVARYVAGLGVAGINIEDGMRDSDLLCRKIAAIKRSAPDVFVNARTDTYWLADGSPEATRRRLDAYLEAGADGVFVPGLRDPSVIGSLSNLAPLNVLYSPGVSVTRLAELGVARVSTGSLLLRMALGTLRGWAGTPTYDEVQALLRRVD